MRVLTGLVFIMNVVLWIAGIIFGFAYEGWITGVPVLIGIITFFIAWHLSGGIVTAPADYFFQPEWTVFKTKLKWANGIGILVGIIAFFILSSLI